MRHSTFARSQHNDALRHRVKVVGTFLLITGLVILFVQTFIGFHTGSVSATSAGALAAAQQPHKLAPLIGEKSWGLWNQRDVGYTFPTTQQPFSMGETVDVSHEVEIRVDQVDRNWQPQAWQQAPSPAGGQDDATGKEVILVRFTITNLSQTPLDYYFDSFSLIRAGGHEQRVATLNDLTPDQFGPFGSGVGWLQPGVTKHTFVPFLVNPGEQPRAFVFSLHHYEPLTASASTPVGATSKGGVAQKYVPDARIVVALPTPGSAQPAATAQVTFTPNATFAVTTSDVYS